ncbi:hypothetical protein BDN71DRAFT_1431671 [Pleurotus eryngii]|uniref:Uncharacterized protein n=1 Tax=Pleurotus eryngii TaxID=5323 RepID=A0A9P5ZYE9_PLEER|nr:hypothetical protein BDN71DRAFT_1431671 [Pleurotus eryngii]
MAKGNHVAPFHKLLSSPSTDVYHLYNPKAKTVDVVHGNSICAFIDAHYNIGHNQITTSSELPSGYEDFACVYNLKPDVNGKFSMIDFTMGVIHIEHTRPSLKKMGLGGNSHVNPALISPTLHSTKTNAGGKVTTEKRKARVAPTDEAKGKKSAKEKKKAVAQTGMNTPLASPFSITTTLFPTMTPISPNLISSVANMMNSSGNSGQLLNAMASPSAITLPGDTQHARWDNVASNMQSLRENYL